LATDVIKRRLAAILAADVVGYSKLMGDDEEGAFNTLRACRQSIDGCVAEKGGRIVATGGDSVLAEFASAVEAVRCALAMQEGIAACNVDLPEERRMRFRIGINLGDVMISDDDILGDGDIAADGQNLAALGSRNRVAGSERRGRYVGISVLVRRRFADAAGKYQGADRHRQGRAENDFSQTHQNQHQFLHFGFMRNEYAFRRFVRLTSHARARDSLIAHLPAIALTADHRI